MSVCGCAHMNTGVAESTDVGCPAAGIIGKCEPLMWVPGSLTYLLRKQYTPPTTESSLQTLYMDMDIFLWQYDSFDYFVVFLRFISNCVSVCAFVSVCHYYMCMNALQRPEA